MRNKVIYLFGAYSGNVDWNIKKARSVAVAVWEAGFTCHCPHLNTAHFEIYSKCTWQDFMDGDFEILSRCDALLAIPGWEHSTGSLAEKAEAERLGIPVFYRLEDAVEYFENGVENWVCPTCKQRPPGNATKLVNGKPCCIYCNAELNFWED